MDELTNEEMNEAFSQCFSFHIDDIDVVIDENHNGNKVMQKALDFLYSWVTSEGVRK